MKKRLLCILITVCMVLTMLPTAVFAAEVETFGDFSVSVTSGSPGSVVSYDNSTKVLKVTGDCTIANTDPDTSTNDTISIESNCTVTLAGVNIKALAPTSVTDLSEPNPININGAYTVTINLEAGKSNILDFTESSTPDAAHLNIRRGSGKAGLHVPAGATLTINGNGFLNSTGAEGFNINDSEAHGGGGAGIGGDGSTSGGQTSETSGTVIIKSGTVTATGGNAAGNWGGGGAGIGGGGGAYNKLGGNSGKITIESGLVTACGGNSGVAAITTAGSGIGAGGGGRADDAAADEVTLSDGAVVQATGGKYGVQGNRITISGDSTRLNAQGTVHALSIEPITSDTGKIVSATVGTWEDQNVMVTFQTAPDPNNPDILIVDAAKTAAENASYSNMSQAAAMDEAAIQTALKSTAETAVDDSSVTVDVNYVAYTLPEAGTSSNPQGTDGSYTFTITVSKGLQSQTTSQKTISITATAYTGVTDVQAVSAAKAALVNGSVEVAFGATQADKTAAVQSYVDSQLSAAADAAGVTAGVTYNSATGSYDVALTKGSEHDSKSLTMTVKVAPDPDIAIVAAAKSAAQDASYSNMSQIAATDETAIQTVLKSIAETAVNDSRVSVDVNYETYTLPEAGTSSNPQGTDGSYTFTITVSKGLQSQTTSQKTISITATAYTGVTDVQAVSAAKAALVNGSVEVAFGATQADKTAAVQSYVDSRLSAAADAAGVTAGVTYNSATGSYDVALSKGSEHDSKILTMTVKVAPDPDIAIVSAAKSAAQDASYSNMSQIAATDETAIQTVLKSIAETAVNDSRVTVDVNYETYTLPEAGTSSNPQGTDGSYTFTITVSKGLQSQTTSQKTITITATAYTGVTDVQAVSAAKAALVNGSVEVAFGATQADKTAAVQSYVDSQLCTAADAAGVTAVVIYNSATGSYDVALSKGSEHDSKILTTTVNVAPDPDIAIVAAAKSAAQDASYSNMSQAAATDEAAIKAALKSTAVAAVKDSNVTVTVNKVSYTAPVSGTSADLAGTNGSYSFTITVSKGSQSQTTIQKTITITATAYTGNNNTGSAGGNSGNIGNNSSSNNGKIVKNEQQDAGAPATSLNTSTEDLKTHVFTKDELSKIAAGENAKVILKVTDISASVSEADKKLITENLKKDTPAVYIDLSLYKQIGNGEAIKVTNTNGMICISFEVPEYLWNTDLTKNRTYKIVRVHDGAAAIIEGTYDPATHLFTFESDKFSTYALAYEDSIINETPVSGNIYPFLLTTKADKLSQTLTYTKVSGADGYFIYGAKCGNKYKLKKLADVTGNIKSYCHKNLKEATYYKYQVKAYRVIDGQKVVIASSNITHSITKGSSFANPVKVTAKTSAVTLEVGESKVVTFKAVLPKGKKMKNHTEAIRYKTTNAAIITVSKNGMIKAKSKGNCYVYAYAQNGVYLKIKVTVQ
ncbi:hypothetical protein R2R35_07890 [Anaerocolumna sp. AGMB13020]|uniref:beta strand repeat-containing protein n=1 Tax=Anaerocolumna sp. AGMB13020 TaxID=3081750 RepID=UPI002952C9D6|nr:hypothetical protein [Anaerocolumna sp. AGMB13020]WOO38414.1 hypothetical protein R2R35_07890 [Anaerocolumna sp. AGMB13020]